MSAPRSRYRLEHGELENYSKGRFFTVTGDIVPGASTEVESRQAEFDALIADLDERLAAGRKKPKARPAGKGKKKSAGSDAAVLKRLKPKAICQRILNGDYSDYDGDQSTCDLVITGAIAREVGPDPEHIDRIIRGTTLMRAKWDEVHSADGRTYGEMTIATALAEYEEPTTGASQKEILLALADDVQLVHTPEMEAFAAVEVEDHTELLGVMSRAFGQWLRHRFWEAQRKGPSAASVRDALLTLEARANFEGEERAVGLRVMADGDNVYLDLGDASWRAVKITAKGCSVGASPPLLRRSRAMLPLPEPVSGGSLLELRPFLNVKDEDDFILLCAWLVAALRPRGPYPVLMINGEQGSAKSVTTRFARALIDPVVAALKSTPKSDRDLMIAAKGSWVLAYDNLSGLTPAMSDGLCRLATGGGLSTRELYTNDEEAIFDAARPIMVNGIDDLSGRPDLLSRAVAVTLPTIEPEKRRTEAAITAEFEAARPRLLGALCDAVACALRRLPDVHLENPPRMSDFATWIVAAEPALPWEPGRFLEAYAANRQAMDDLALDLDRFASIIIEMMRHCGEWSGTATDLLEEVRGLPGSERRGNDLPQTPRGVSNRLHRIAPLLRTNGLDVQFRKGSERRIIITGADGPKDRVIADGAHMRIRPPHGNPA
jgi:NrS-1  polymerase HBD domain